MGKRDFPKGGFFMGSVFGAFLSLSGGEDKVRWFRDAKFGMFIHWGIYSVLGRGEWVMYNERIQVQEYEKLCSQFDPKGYNPRDWVALAKEAGMRYITVTTKHHDGFCMFDSELTDYDCMSTPAKRDFIGELVEACREAGIGIMFYYSLLDWHHPDYLPRRPWETATRPAMGADFNRYIDYLFGQIRELCTKYGKIDGIWFDGGWEHGPDEWRSERLLEMIRELQSDALINDRAGIPGDFETPEQYVPEVPPKGRMWETCMTINDSWGYNAGDCNYKSVSRLIRTLVEVVSKGGNLLLNVGPRPDGTIQPEFVSRLKMMGRWLEENGDAIYGTEPSPFRRTPWGGCTVKGSIVYLHLFDYPADPITIDGLRNRVLKAYVKKGEVPVPFRQDDLELVLEPPAIIPDPYDTVVVLEVEGEPEAENILRQGKDGSIELLARDAELHGSMIRYEYGGGRDNIGFWTNTDDYVTWNLIVERGGVFFVHITYSCDRGAGGSEYILDVGGSRIRGVVRETGGWDKFEGERVGRMSLVPGRHRVLLKALSKPGYAVMNLRKIEFIPGGE
jgi:alpha-L-fucosidase